MLERFKGVWLLVSDVIVRLHLAVRGAQIWRTREAVSDQGQPEAPAGEAEKVLLSPRNYDAAH